MNKIYFSIPQRIAAVLFLGFLFSAPGVLAQEKYKVVYDYNTEKVSYYRLDKNNEIADTLQRPRFKRSSLVEIELQNVNPFAVEVLSDVREENLEPAGSGFDFSSLLGGISSFSGSQLNLNLENLPADTLFNKSGKSRGAAVTSSFNDLSEISANVSAIRNTLMANLLNPNLDKEAISQNLKDIAGQGMDARLTDPNENFYLYLSSVEKVVQSSKQEIAGEISAMTKDIEQQEQSEEPLSRGEMVARNMAYTNLQELMTSLNTATASATADINEIKTLYSMLEASSFSRIYDYQMDADKANLELKFVQSEFALQADSDNTRNTVKTRNIQIFSRGGFKINTGIAFTLNNFDSKSFDYFINEEGVIGADNNDFFVPNLSTMINFYPVIGENFNIGGSFGISIPVSSNLNGINYLFGPSLFLGSTSKVSLSGGLAYGPVTRLTSGLRVGDTTTARDLGSYTKSVYDLGYFFGVSFSLFDIK